MGRDRGPIVHRLAQATSTQGIARRYIDLGAARAGHVVVADEQTEGVGRRGRTWVSPPGGLYASFIVPAERLNAVRAGVAAARAVEALSVPVRLKWPNDLVVGSAKLGGIVIEVLKALALVGIGINVDACPVEGSTCLRDSGAAADHMALAQAIYEGLSAERTDQDVLAEYRERLVTLGQNVRVDQGNGIVVSGLAVNVDDDGRLVLETAHGLVSVAAGDCIHLRT